MVNPAIEKGAALAERITPFDGYRTKYPSRPPNLETKKHEDELRQLSTAEGLNELAAPPYEPAKIGAPPRAEREAEDTKYLWVVGISDVPFALELLPEVKLGRGRLSHTNLTGGRPAHSGGEMWFTSTSTIVMNGGSGRYPPRSLDELNEVAQAVKAMGYQVAHMGWDTGTGRARRYLRDDPRWL